MNQFLGKLSLYDIIVMIIPGGTILLFFLDYYGVDLLYNGSCGISSLVSVSAMLVYTRQKNIAQVFILERYFFVSIYPAAIPGTYLAMFLVAVLQLC